MDKESTMTNYTINPQSPLKTLTAKQIPTALLRSKPSPKTMKNSAVGQIISCRVRALTLLAGPVCSATIKMVLAANLIQSSLGAPPPLPSLVTLRGTVGANGTNSAGEFSESKSGPYILKNSTYSFLGTSNPPATTTKVTYKLTVYKQTGSMINVGAWYSDNSGKALGVLSLPGTKGVNMCGASLSSDVISLPTTQSGGPLKQITTLGPLWMACNTLKGPSSGSTTLQLTFGH